MLIFQRDLEPQLRKNLFKNKLIILYGPRQAGKTTLSKKIVESYKEEGQYFDCQLVEVREAFEEGNPKKLKDFVGNKKIVVFDEAQTIQDIGTILKVFHDHYPKVQVIATGSSSFDLANKIIEPLTGRSIEYTLLPLSLSEIKKVTSVSEMDLMNIFKYGNYPEIVGLSTIEEKESALKNIATNYLYKDIFTLEQIRYPIVFEKLLKALAYQVGSIVSSDELAKMSGTSPTTINRYLRLLEQAFIIKIIRAFSNNPRVELSKAYKVYFIDTGVRNVLVGMNTELLEGNHKGQVFENFLFTEIFKKHTLVTFPPDLMFWRTRQKLEIDFIEKIGSEIIATECKWGNEKVVFTKFLELYPKAKVTTVRMTDFLTVAPRMTPHLEGAIREVMKEKKSEQSPRFKNAKDADAWLDAQ